MFFPELLRGAFVGFRNPPKYAYNQGIADMAACIDTLWSSAIEEPIWRPLPSRGIQRSCIFDTFFLYNTVAPEENLEDVWCLLTRSSSVNKFQNAILISQINNLIMKQSIPSRNPDRLCISKTEQVLPLWSLFPVVLKPLIWRLTLNGISMVFHYEWTVSHVNSLWYKSNEDFPSAVTLCKKHRGLGT